MGLSTSQVVAYAQQAGFTGDALVTAVAVALAETRGSLDPNSHNTNGEDSRGLWQINVGPGAHPSLASLNLYDPLTNAQQAYAISSGGTNWGPWTTYTGGLYLSYINQARLAVAAAGLPVIGGVASSAVDALGSGGTSNVNTPSAPFPVLPDLPQAISHAVGDPAGAINNLAQQVATATNNVTSGIEQFHNLISWLGQPNLWYRILLTGVGGVLLIVGIILFAFSFRGVEKAGATVAKAVPVA